MARARRSNDWGFPRWRDYGATGTAPEAQRLCDRAGCGKPGLDHIDTHAIQHFP